MSGDMAIQNMVSGSVDAIGKAALDKAAGQTKSSAPQNIDKIDEAAKEFESVFMSQMLSHMFAGLETDEIFGGGQAEQVYRDMMVQEYGKLITEAGGIGMAASVKAEMIKMQEGLLQS